MELRNTIHTLLFVLMFIQCQTLEQTKPSEDVPMNVNLGQQLVGRKNASEIRSTASPIFMEGGLLNKTTTVAPVLNKGGDSLKSLLGSDSSHLPDDMVASWPSEGHDKNSSSKPRKGAPICSCCVNITTEEQLKNCTCCPPDFKIPSSSTTPTTKSTITIVTTHVPKIEPTVTTISTSKPSTSPEPVPVIHHKKPNVTADVPDPQVPAQQQDYVIPVVGIIFAVPLIIILGALVYKKGADLWERRHYRRMDFLIDGIYNNQ